MCFNLIYRHTYRADCAKQPIICPAISSIARLIIIAVCAMWITTHTLESSPQHSVAPSTTPKKTESNTESKAESSSTKAPTSKASAQRGFALDSASLIEHEKKKELYFLRAQYYQYLRKQAHKLENNTRSSAFVGVVLGASNLDITLKRGKKDYPVSLSPLAVGLSGGYLRFIGTAPIAVRVYGQYLGAWNTSADITDSVQAHLFSFNLDIVGDLAITEDGYYLGAYAGIGGGLEVFKQTSANPNTSEVSRIVVGSVVNFGLSATLAYHHRLEAGVKIPPNAYNENFKFNLMYLISYHYLF